MKRYFYIFLRLVFYIVLTMLTMLSYFVLAFYFVEAPLNSDSTTVSTPTAVAAVWRIYAVDDFAKIIIPLGDGMPTIFTFSYPEKLSLHVSGDIITILDPVGNCVHIPANYDQVTVSYSPYKWYILFEFLDTKSFDTISVRFYYKGPLTFLQFMMQNRFVKLYWTSALTIIIISLTITPIF